MTRFPPIIFILPALVTILVLKVPAKNRISHTINRGQARAFWAPTDLRASVQQSPLLERMRSIVDELIASSYPELRGVEIHLSLFNNDTDYFRTRFGIPQFLFGRRMRYLIRVNPEVGLHHAPEAGLRSILAHEMAHILYFKAGNRARLLGLARLASNGFTARFERWTDLQAISRGYGE